MSKISRRQILTGAYFKFGQKSLRQKKKKAVEIFFRDTIFIYIFIVILFSGLDNDKKYALSCQENPNFRI